MLGQSLQGDAQEWGGGRTWNVTRFEIAVSRKGDRLSARGNEVFRGVLAIVGCYNIHHIVTGKSGGSVKAG